MRIGRFTGKASIGRQSSAVEGIFVRWPLDTERGIAHAKSLRLTERLQGKSRPATHANKEDDFSEDVPRAIKRMICLRIFTPLKTGHRFER